MAQLCNDGCHIICDFCWHYKDYSKINNTKEFDGEGICEFDGSETDACSGCDNFKCFRLGV